MKKVFLGLVLAIGLMSCTIVESGHKAVVEEMGKTDMETVLPEGVHYGMSWLWKDAIMYNVQDNTVTASFDLNDNKEMPVTILTALSYQLNPKKVQFIHRDINDVNTEIMTSLSSAVKEVVVKYTAVDLNKNKRQEAEDLLYDLLKSELAEFHVILKRVKFTDIDLPKKIVDRAIEKADQLAKNELTATYKVEKQNIADANKIEIDGKLAVEKVKDEIKAIQSKKAYLELYRAETERMWAEQGKSPYGTNNMFGVQSASILKNLK